MSPADLATIERALSVLGAVGDDDTDSAVFSAVEALGLLRRRDWAVRVLWAASAKNHHMSQPYPSNGCWAIIDTRNPGLQERDTIHAGATAEAVTITAALAVFPTLPEDVRADLGNAPERLLPATPELSVPPMPAAPTALARLFSAQIVAGDPSAVERVRAALVRNAGNMQRTAAELGVSLRTLHRWGEDPELEAVGAVINEHRRGRIGRGPSTKTPASVERPRKSRKKPTVKKR